MKITESQLRSIIKQELTKMMNEGKFKAGDKVETPSGRRGTIVTDLGDGSYDVKWSDGAVEAMDDYLLVRSR